MASERLYARFGDSDDYHDVGGHVEMVDELKNLGIGWVWRQGEYGLAADGYTGQNYISAFYGSDVGTPTRGLTDQEIGYINNAL